MTALRLAKSGVHGASNSGEGKKSWLPLLDSTPLCVDCLPLSSSLHPDFANSDLAMHFLSRWHHREFGEVGHQRAVLADGRDREIRRVVVPNVEGVYFFNICFLVTESSIAILNDPEIVREQRGEISLVLGLVCRFPWRFR
jgi:hypothetical protein